MIVSSRQNFFCRLPEGFLSGCSGMPSGGVGASPLPTVSSWAVAASGSAPGLVLLGPGLAGPDWGSLAPGPGSLGSIRGLAPAACLPWLRFRPTPVITDQGSRWSCPSGTSAAGLLAALLDPG